MTLEPSKKKTKRKKTEKDAEVGKNACSAGRCWPENGKNISVSKRQFFLFPPFLYIPHRKALLSTQLSPCPSRQNGG
jgi:hypothetical protein